MEDSKGERRAEMSDLDLRTSVGIEAPPEDVWKALTTPAQIKRWFFGVDTETDWKVGSPLVHRGVYQGKPYEDKGAIVEFDPPRTLAHSHWSPASGTPDTPENYQLVRWTLQERDGQTELTVAEDNLPSDEARTASEQAWELALNGLKEMLENDEHPA
jgi:uncharacterized protein YndB with AHSA1/START domain